MKKMDEMSNLELILTLILNDEPYKRIILKTSWLETKTGEPWRKQNITKAFIALLKTIPNKL